MEVKFKYEIGDKVILKKVFNKHNLVGTIEMRRITQSKDETEISYNFLSDQSNYKNEMSREKRYFTGVSELSLERLPLEPTTIKTKPFRVAIGDEGEMSSLQGKINCSYSKLVEVFGKPSEGLEDISEVQWSIMIGDTYVSIYDYKNPNPPKENTMWHIGGFSEDAVTKVKKILGL